MSYLAREEWCNDKINRNMGCIEIVTRTLVYQKYER